MYDPKVGRFLKEDPIGTAGGDPNFYRYCGNRPTDRTDPSGLKFDSVEAAAWAAAEAYAVNHGWGVSALVLDHFNTLSNSSKYAPGAWGPPLNLMLRPPPTRSGR